MARTFINLSLCLAGLIACLSAEAVQARSKTNLDKKLYHERKASPIEEVFRKLPSIESEVESIFDDASFYSSLGASPQANDKANKDVEDLFRRILLSPEKGKKKVEGRNLSFIGNKMEEAGILGGGGVRGAVSASGDEIPIAESHEIAAEIAEEESERIEMIVKSSKKYKSSKKSSKGKGSSKSEKSPKKGKKYKDDKGKTANKLQKSGKKDPNFSYDPYDGEDDEYDPTDDFDFGDWEWEFESESEDTPMAQMSLSTPFDKSESVFKDTGFGGITALVPEGGAGGLMGRFDEVKEEGQNAFANFVGNMDGPNAPVTIEAKKVAHYKFNFPSIQHVVFSGPVYLKAHSSTDLSTMDPEIFAVVESIMTPYLHQTVGSALHAYNLEIDYYPGHDGSVGRNDVVTLMEVKVAMKVISDSVLTFKDMDHSQASRWVNDFFAGPDHYNRKKIVEALQNDGIPVNDIVFADQQFSVSAANSQIFGNGNPKSTTKNTTKKAGGDAIIAVTVSVIIVGLIFSLHYAGVLPSRAKIGEFSLNAQSSISDAKSSFKARIPSVKFPKKRDSGDEGGRRRRTLSGTFKKFNKTGIRKAAIQKKPAKSEQYLDSASEPSSKKSNNMDEYSFSRYAGDYGPSTPSRNSSVPPMTPISRGTEDEFSMPSNYDSAHSSRFTSTNSGRSDSLMGKIGSLLNPPGRKSRPANSPVPPLAPRRVTGNDIADPNDVDNWSIDSYETEVKSGKSGKSKSPSNHPLYRGWNEAGPEMRRPQQAPAEPEETGKSKLFLPFFS